MSNELLYVVTRPSNSGKCNVLIIEYRGLLLGHSIIIDTNSM